MVIMPRSSCVQDVTRAQVLPGYSRQNQRGLCRIWCESSPADTTRVLLARNTARAEGIRKHVPPDPPGSSMARLEQGSRCVLGDVEQATGRRRADLRKIYL